MRKEYTLISRNQKLKLGKNTIVMGILNVTPDSFSENGCHFDTKIAVCAALKMIADGANIIDIGGESTRPGAAEVTVQEELARTIPVICALRKQSDILISIDTSKSEIAEEALKNGAHIVNDISGLRKDLNMAAVTAKYNAGCIVMHMRGTPQTMQNFLEYDDLIYEIHKYFEETLNIAYSAGLKKENMVIDPGIGFSKNIKQNLELIRSLKKFSTLDIPILLGPSRKSFIGKTLNIENAKERIWGTASTVALAIANGAHIIRVHDIQEMTQVARMTDAILKER